MDASLTIGRFRLIFEAPRKCPSHWIFAVRLRCGTLPIGTRAGTHDATFNAAVALMERGGAISDIVEFTIVSTNGVQTWTGQFISDSDRGSLTLPTNAFVVTIPETGGAGHFGRFSEQ